MGLRLYFLQHSREARVSRCTHCIGAFKEEQNAIDLLTSLSWQLPLFMAASALVDLLLVLVYMKWLHPWRDTLQDVSRTLRSWSLGVPACSGIQHPHTQLPAQWSMSMSCLILFFSKETAMLRYTVKLRQLL